MKHKTYHTGHSSKTLQTNRKNSDKIDTSKTHMHDPVNEWKTFKYVKQIQINYNLLKVDLNKLWRQNK